MLLTKEVEIVLNSANVKHFEDLKYTIPRKKDKWGKIRIPRGTIINVKVEDLSNGSHVKVDIECDGCGKELKNIIWQNYLNYVKEDGKYYCKKCASLLFGSKKQVITKLKNSTSFEIWCINNNRQDVLDRWDYELNDCIPNEITYGTTKKYYFKCPKGIHNSELKLISSFTSNHDGVMDCKQCNSFAQWGIDNLGEDFLEKYWDYEKNNKLNIDPWNISKCSNIPKIYIICQEKDYHDSYKTICDTFTNNHRCPYCVNSGGLVHPLDSLGALYPQVLDVWSDKNKKSPYGYASKSHEEVYWKCSEGKHRDYPRSIKSSNVSNFRCPECAYSKGEEAINNYFINKGFIKIFQEDFNKLNDREKYNKIFYIPQKEFDGLVGLRNGLLSYDFYIPKLNLLIEYHGMQHEKYCRGFHESMKDFERQLEHDNRKCIYADNNSINLLVIWYWDFDKVEEILNKIILDY